MEIENNSYYKSIIYKKNAFNDIKTFIKLNYNNKRILLISTKSIPAENVTSLLNSLFCGSEKVSHYVARSNFDLNELQIISDKIKEEKYSLLVSFGGGKCCDVVKYFASEFNLPYIVCPTVASSLAYFSNYCINPFDSTKSFYATFPKKIFIQEELIKKSTCLFNIQGLCFLHSLRSVYVEGLINDVEKDRYIFLGLEKLFNKLDLEETNILLCDEDANLVLMDLFIDFGFFIGQLNRDDFFLFNMFKVYEKMFIQFEMSGKMLLLCAKEILGLMKQFIEINSVKVFEKNNYLQIAKILKNYKINYLNLKNNLYFIKFNKKNYIKKQFLDNKDNYYKIISLQLLKIKEFNKKVKSVFKYGLEIEEKSENSFKALGITPFLYGKNMLIDLIANSGIINSLIVS